MSRESILKLLGLCRVSGNVKSGEELTEAAVKSGKACLVLLSEDASGNTRKKFHDKCTFYEVAIIDTPFSKAEIGKAMGQSERSCLAVMSEGFSEKLKKEINQMMGEI